MFFLFTFNKNVSIDNLNFHAPNDIDYVFIVKLLEIAECNIQLSNNTVLENAF